MKRVFSTLALAAVLGFGAAGAANASGPASLVPKPAASVNDMVTEVQNPCGRWGCRDPFAYGRGDSSRTWRRGWDRHDWRGGHDYRRSYRSGPSFRLYVQPRAVPRYVEPRPVYRLSSAHVAWCNARYRSYRSWDNSWQPYHGARRSCVSPFR